MSKVEVNVGFITREYVIVNKFGIHARPAALFVKTAARFDADVYVEKGSAKVSGKSIMGLMTLEASHGSKVKITVEGREATAMLAELEKLIRAGFNEE